MNSAYIKSVPFSEIDITFFSAHLYIINSDCGTPTNTYPTTSATSYNKNNLWIIPIQDYTNNERVKTSTIYHISVPEKIPPLQYYHPRQKV